MKSFKKQYLIIFLLFIIFTAAYVGYVSSSDADILKKYLEPEELKGITENPIDNIWIIDVRPSSAYKNGHIPTAKSFPSSEILNRLNELSKDQYLIFYCETGGRAQAIINKLEKTGYTKMMNWGGFSRWTYPSEK